MNLYEACRVSSDLDLKYSENIIKRSHCKQLAMASSFIGSGILMVLKKNLLNRPFLHKSAILIEV